RTAARRQPGRVAPALGLDGQRRHAVPLPAAAKVDGEKKVRRAAEQDRPDVRQKRQQWAEARPGLDVGRLVFIDETGATTAMSRLYGRAPAGARPGGGGAARGRAAT